MTIRAAMLVIAALAGAAHAAPPAGPPAATATATGRGATAINASGQAQVVIRNYNTDPRVEQALRLLARNDHDAQRLVEENRRLAGENARLNDYIRRAVITTIAAADAPSAKPAEREAARRLQAGDTAPAAAELGRKAALPGAASADLLFQQAALLRESNVQQAFAIAQKASTLRPPVYGEIILLEELAIAAGQPDLARRYLQAARQIEVRAQAADPTNPDHQSEIASLDIDIAETMPGGIGIADEYRLVLQKLTAAERLVALKAGDVPFQLRLAAAQIELGHVLRRDDRDRLAIERYRKAFDILTALAKQYPNNDKVTDLLAEVNDDLAYVMYLNNGKHDIVQAHYDDAIRLRKSLIDAYPQSVDHQALLVLYYLDYSRMQYGRNYEDREKMLVEATAVAERAAALDRGYLVGQMMPVRAHVKLGDFYWSDGYRAYGRSSGDEALRHYQVAKQLADDMLRRWPNNDSVQKLADTASKRVTNRGTRGWP